VPGDDAVTVITSRFDEPIGGGLEAVLRNERGVRVLACDLVGVALERAIARERPRVAIFDEKVDHALLVGLGMRHPKTGVVVLARDPSHVLGTALLAVGVTCLARVAAAATVLEALHCAARIEPMFFRPDGARLARGGQTVAEVLTPREREVFVLLSKEASYAAIALELVKDIETVRSHAASVRRKLGARNKQQLVGMRLSSRLKKAEP
jgi:DNA-binding NarL/FixJ family response regulator